MSFRDWIDVPALKAQSKHITGVVGALFSFFVISTMGKYLIGPGRFSDYLGFVDRFVLFVVILVFGVRLVYYFIKGSGGNGHADIVLVV